MDRARGQLVLIVTDTLLAACLEMVKIRSKFMVNNEFSLNFSDVYEISPFYLYGAALLTLIVAATTDSLFCKYFPIIVGLVAGLLASVCAVVEIWTATEGEFMSDLLFTLCRVFLLIYISTSAVRDMFIIEQIKFPSPFRIHSYMFFLVYPKIIVRLLCDFGCEKLSPLAFKLTLTVLLVVFMLYVFVFTFGFIMYFYIEPIYKGMWKHSWLCFSRSVCKKREKGKKESFDSLDTHNIIISELEVTKKCIGYKAITTEKPSGKVAEKSPTPEHGETQERKDTIKEKEKAKEPDEQQSYFNINFRGWLGSIVAPAKKEEDEEPPDDEDPEQQRIRERKSKSHISFKAEVIFKKHWLHNAAPNSTEYVIIQTAILFQVLNVIIAGCFFSWLDYYLSAITHMQSDISARNVESVFDSFETRRIAFGCDVFTFPIFYFLFFPLLYRTFRRDIRFFFLGYLMIFAANIFMLCVQARATVGQIYVPGPTSGQIRFYNGLDSNITIEPAWDSSLTFRAPPHGEHVILDIEGSYNVSQKQVKITSETPELTSNTDATIIEGQTTCYVVTKTEKELNISQIGGENGTDITAFGKKHETLVEYRVLSAFTEEFNTIEIYFEERLRDKDLGKGKKVYQRLSEPGLIYTVEPGEYNILVKYGTQPKSGYSLTKPALMEKWGVYSIFFYKSSDGRLEANFFHLEGPPGISYSIIYYHLILASFARAFATVAFLIFIYSESPEKLRATVISLVLFFNLLWLAIFNTDFIQKYNHGSHMTFMVIFLFLHGIIFVTLFLTTRIRHRHPGYF